MKKCGRCQIVKEDSEFSPSQLTRSGGKCRPCNTAACAEYRKKNPDKMKKYNKEYGSQYYQENYEQILAQKKEYYQDNKEEKLQWQKEYYQEHKEERQEYNQQYYQDNRDELIKDAKEYYENNKESVKQYHNEYNKDRRQNDPTFRIRNTVSASINFYLKSNNSSKDGASCLDYLPYSIQELKGHLEKQFEPWMTWDNYGRYDAENWNDNDPTTWTWQIDHIIPQSKLLYTSMTDENFQKCWALSNLRPLPAKQNFMDGVRRVRH